MEFEIRVCISGSSGVAFYMPADVVKKLKLKKEINTKISATLDDEGDIIIYTSEIGDK